MRNLENIKAEKFAKKEKERMEERFGGSPDQMSTPEKSGNFDKPKEKPHKWEIDWDKYDEEEALERLSRLSDYDTMTPAEIESKMRSIREDPSSLANYEAEDKMQQEIKRANDDGIQLTLGDMQRLGAQVTCSIGPTLKVTTPLTPHSDPTRRSTRSTRSAASTTSTWTRAGWPPRAPSSLSGRSLLFARMQLPSLRTCTAHSHRRLSRSTGHSAAATHRTHAGLRGRASRGTVHDEVSRSARF